MRVATHASSFVKTGNDAYDIIAQPHIVKIVSDVQNKADADYPCKKEVEDAFECLEEDCIACFVTIIEDLDEDTTCEALKADDTFCTAVEGCVVECGKKDCTGPAMKLETCAAKNYPDAVAEEEDPCPGLCEEPTYKIA